MGCTKAVCFLVATAFIWVLQLVQSNARSTGLHDSLYWVTLTYAGHSLFM
jgi:hypothetical protein